VKLSEDSLADEHYAALSRTPFVTRIPFNDDLLRREVRDLRTQAPIQLAIRMIEWNRAAV